MIAATAAESLVNGQVAPDYRTYGARVQIPWVISPAGWGIFIGQPQGTFEFTQQEGIFRGVEATSTRNVFVLLGDGPAEVLKRVRAVDRLSLHAAPLGPRLSAIAPHTRRQR